MSKRKVSIVLALAWLTVVVMSIVAVQARGAERYGTAEIIFDKQGGVVDKDSGIFGNRRKPKENEEPRTEPYDPNTAPKFDFPSADSPLKGTSLAGLFAQIDFDNLIELIVPLLALFGGFQIGSSDPSIKMILTLIRKLKGDKFGEIIKSITKSDDPAPVE